jgi:predicted CXXCH cytochrome family protein
MSVALVAASAMGVGRALAADGTASRTPVPHPPRGQGEHCVADTEFMRRNHMTMLIHQRRDTVHEGVRNEKFSLARCLSCHAVQGEDGKPVTYADSRHFCRSCHGYAAVKIDCFECHTSRPDEPSKSAFISGADPAVAALVRHIQEMKP